jgi:hypothetical protein
MGRDSGRPEMRICAWKRTTEGHGRCPLLHSTWPVLMYASSTPLSHSVTLSPARAS